MIYERRHNVNIGTRNNRASQSAIKVRNKFCKYFMDNKKNT